VSTGLLAIIMVMMTVMMLMLYCSYMSVKRSLRAVDVGFLAGKLCFVLTEGDDVVVVVVSVHRDVNQLNTVDNTNNAFTLEMCRRGYFGVRIRRIPSTGVRISLSQF